MESRFAPDYGTMRFLGRHDQGGINQGRQNERRQSSWNPGRCLRLSPHPVEGLSALWQISTPRTPLPQPRFSSIFQKFNFGDESEANVAFLTSLIHELTTIAFKTTLEKFAFVANISPKLGRNLRILMRRMSKTHPEEACRAYLGKLVAELRDLFP